MRVLFTKGMIAVDFLGDPTSTGLDMPSQTHRASGGLTAGSCGPFLFGSTKLAGEGRLWRMMRCAPLSRSSPSRSPSSRSCRRRCATADRRFSSRPRRRSEFSPAATGLVGMDVVLVVADPALQPSTPNTGRSPGSDAGEGVGTAVYGEGHSRPAQPHSRPGTAAGENAPTRWTT